MSSRPVPVMWYEIVQPCYGTQKVEKTSDNKSPITCQPKYGILCLFEKRTQPTGSGAKKRSALKASYLIIAKAKKPHTIAESIIEPA